MQGVYCSKNETKAPDHGDGSGALKKLVKKVKEGEDEDWCDPAVQEKYFNMVDDDESGSVDADELTVVAQAHGMTADEAKDMFDLMDENDDGKVSFEELCAWWKRTGRGAPPQRSDIALARTMSRRLNSSLGL